MEGEHYLPSVMVTAMEERQRLLPSTASHDHHPLQFLGIFAHGFSAKTKK